MKMADLILKKEILLKAIRIALLGTIVNCLPSFAQKVSFSDITSSKQVAGYWRNNAYVFGHGVAFADLNGDSKPELYVSNAAEGQYTYPDLLYINRPDKTWLEDATARGLADDYGIGSHGLVFFDMDNDGDFDVYNGNTYQEPYSHTYNRLYRNNNSGYFEDVTTWASLPNADSGTRSVAAFDANNDGLIDLFSVGSKTLTYGREPYCFYLNQGDGKFKSVDWGTAAMAEDGFGPNGLTIADYDNDGEQEIYISRVDRAQKGARANNQLLDKGPDGKYRDLAGILNVRGGGWSDGATFADFDNDGDLDLFVASSNDKQLQRLYIYRNNGDGTFTDLTAERNIYQQGFSALLFDVDNDGDLDLYTPSKDSSPQYNHLYLNDGHGDFTVAEGTGLEIPLFDPRGAATADIDGDGDLDLYVTDTNKGYQSQYTNHLFRNSYSGSNRWLKISGRGPMGDQGAFGSKIWLYEKKHINDPNYLISYRQIISTYGFCCQDDPVQHFGLGQRDTVAVRIQMTDGTTLLLPQMAAKKTLLFSKPKTLNLTSGNDQSVVAGQSVPLPFQVRVTDSYGNPVAGVAIQFTAAQGLIRPALPVYTDLQGLASVTYVTGATPATQKIYATSALLPGQTIEFSVTATPADRIATQITPLSVLQQTGVAGKLLSDSTIVQVSDKDRLPVAGVQVLFRIYAGAGKVNNKDSVLVSSNSNGKAAVAWRMGNKSGSRSNDLVVIAKGLAGSPIHFVADTQPGSPYVLALQGGDQQTVPLFSPFPRSLQTVVMDAFGNLVGHVLVRFNLKGGEAAFIGHAGETFTNELGVAEIFLTAGATAGAVIVQASADMAGVPLLQSPVLFHLLVQSPILDARLSSLTFDKSSAVANGHDGIWCTLSLRDANGKSVAHIPATLQVSGSDTKISMSGVTDSTGVAKGYISSTHAQQKTAWISTPYGDLTVDSIQVQFVAGAAARIVKLAGDEQVGKVRRPLDSTLVIAVTDSFANAVAGVVLHANEKQPDGQWITWPDLITNAEGICSWLWTLGEKAGTYQLLLRADAGPSIQFRSRATQRSPASMIVVAGDHQVGKSGSSLPVPLTVQVLDSYSEPVAGALVRFSIIKGGGHLSATQPVSTDSLGMVLTVWTLGDSDEQRAGAQVVDYGTLKAVFDASRRVNHAPEVARFIPADSILSLSRYGHLFSVGAVDSDQDSLHFIWTVNGVAAGHDSIFQFMPVPGQRSGTRVVVRVDDGELSVQHSWILYYPTDVDQEKALPLACSLEQNFPNPFNPVTTIRFTLTKHGWIQLRIYDEHGHQVRTLVESNCEPGSLDAVWDAKDDDGRPVGSGVYLCRLQGTDFRLVRKILYIK
jgi:enediyne biosynthesis protein E4